jgi:CRISPR-associated protein Csy1
VSHYFKGWIEQANHDDFEVYAYQLDGRADEVSESIAAHCDQFRRLTGSLTRMGNAIRQDQLDILVYLEVGMSKKARWLSATRLAPIQCSAWGHPVTTGLSTIDYYLSGGDTEPDNGDDYYSESLVRLNGLGIYCSPRLAPDDGDRKALGLPEGRNLYLCPQSLFKIHPDADRLFARIAAQDVNALILFFEGKTIPLGTRTKQRLEPIFQQEGADFERQTKFLPQMNHPNYLRLNRLADVMLDVPHWSGGMTSLDALANGLPIITLEGEQSRGRQTSAMYRMMGITDLIAADDAAYVTTAIKLAQDAELKAHYSKQIMGRMEETLFHNPDAVPSLEEFYRQAHGETRENRP